VCRFALRFGAGSLADAEDIASQTFEILLVNRLLDRWTSNRSAKLRSLLCSVVRNVLANRHRVREGRQRLLPDLLQHFRQLDETRSESSDDFYAAWAEDLLQQAVEAMAADYFAEGRGDLVRVLYGRVCQGHTVAEVAEALDIAPRTVDSYYRQARDRLARKLEEALGEQMRQHGNTEEEAEEFAEEWKQLGHFLADHGGLEAALHRAYALLDPVKNARPRAAAIRAAVERLTSARLPRGSVPSEKGDA
jgi:RNA polymerase sigma factor (sigma-70 family)